MELCKTYKTWITFFFELRMTTIFTHNDNFFFSWLDTWECFGFSRCRCSFGLLICTLTSENLGLEKSSSTSNPRKFSGSANLDFFPGLHLEKSGLILQTWKKSRCQTLKKSRFAEPEIFLGFEIDLDFSRPWFSEIRVQIKRPSINPVFFQGGDLEKKSRFAEPEIFLKPNSCC